MHDVDPYDGFAERYDRFYGAFGEHTQSIIEFYRVLLDRNRVHTVLDCACGTGRDLTLFHALGCEVVGSDISAAMLAQAARNLTTAGLDIPLHRADYRELPEHFDRRFDAVVCLSSSILHMPDEPEAIRAFRSMRQVLNPDGILILTQGTTDKQWRERPRFVLAVDQPEFSRLFVIDYLDRGARYNIVDIVRGDEAPRLEVWSVEYAQILLIDDYRRLLTAAEYQPLSFYGSYGFDRYDELTSDRLIVVAQKA
jgi:SAM-dependent methyltransferase